MNSHAFTAAHAQGTLILIPAYNAEGSIAAVVTSARAVGPEVLVVDDGSTDGTAAAAAGAGARVLRHARNRGKGAALQTGFAHAAAQGMQSVLTLDADGQHDPAEARKLLAAAAAQPESLIIGVRSFDPALMPRRSRIGNQISTFFISRFAHRPHRDTQSGFRIYPRRLFTMPLRTRRFDTETELLLWAAKLGIPLCEVPIQTIYHGHGPGHSAAHAPAAPEAPAAVSAPGTPAAAPIPAAQPPDGAVHKSHFRNWEDTLRVIRLVIGSPWWRTEAARSS